MIEMEIDKVFWCDKCGRVELGIANMQCPNCNSEMAEIGFVEDELTIFKRDEPGKASVGGSVKPGFCKCGLPRASKGIDQHGRRRYRTQCYKCLYKARSLIKSDKCAICRVIPEKTSDLHIDHIDGDRSNNTSRNIQTLCVECHKYKTKKQEDWKKKDARKILPKMQRD